MLEIILISRHKICSHTLIIIQNPLGTIKVRIKFDRFIPAAKTYRRLLLVLANGSPKPTAREGYRRIEQKN